MTPEAKPTTLLLSSDFFPKIGGAHHWLYEVYRRWPETVKGIVQDYSSDMVLKQEQDIFDHQPHGSLRLHRMNLQLDDINLMIPKLWLGLIKILRQVSLNSAQQATVVHCLRAFPDGLIGLVFKCLNRSNHRLITYAHGEEILTAATSRQLTWIAKKVYL